MVISRSAQSLSKTKELCVWVTEHAGEPSLCAPYGSDERNCAVWLSRRRYSIKKGMQLANSEEVLLAQYNLKNVFSTGSRQVRSGGLSDLYAMWVGVYGTEPSRECADPVGSTLYRWITRKRSGETKIYEDDVAALQATNVPNLLSKLSREDFSNFMAVSFSIFYKKNNKLPKKNSTDPVEAKLSNWYANKRQSLKGNVRVTFYTSDEEILKKNGVWELFSL